MGRRESAGPVAAPSGGRGNPPGSVAFAKPPAGTWNVRSLWRAVEEARLHPAPSLLTAAAAAPTVPTAVTLVSPVSPASPTSTSRSVPLPRGASWSLSPCAVPPPRSMPPDVAVAAGTVASVTAAAVSPPPSSTTRAAGVGDHASVAAPTVPVAGRGWVPPPPTSAVTPASAPPPAATPGVAWTAAMDARLVRLFTSATDKRATPALVDARLPGVPFEAATARWADVLRPSLLGAPWSPAVDAAILDAVLAVGAQWALIAARLGGCYAAGDVRERYVRVLAPALARVRHGEGGGRGRGIAKRRRTRV